MDYTQYKNEFAWAWRNLPMSDVYKVLEDLYKLYDKDIEDAWETHNLDILLNADDLFEYIQRKELDDKDNAMIYVYEYMHVAFDIDPREIDVTLI